MGRFIIKLKDKYLEWGTGVDAPITYGMSLEEFKAFYKEEYGRNGMENLDERLKRVEEKGVSTHWHKNVEEAIRLNRAGENESCISIEEIIEKYC